MAEDEPLFTWLHISDIHWSHGDVGHGQSQEYVAQELIGDLSRCCKLMDGQVQPDVIFLTGDVAHAGGTRQTHRREREYRVAYKWLKQICTGVGLVPRKVYAVAGNHDVDRTAGTDVLTKRLLDDLRQGTPLDEALNNGSYRTQIEARQASFLKFAGQLAPESRRLYWKARLKGRGQLKLRVIGLNTALLSGGDDDWGKLQLGKLQTLGAFMDPPVEDDEVVLVLSHHPFSGGWLRDEAEVSTWAKARCHVHLFGHVHEAGSLVTEYGREGRLFAQVAAAAVHADPNDPIHGYNLGAIVRRADGSLVLRIQFRFWSKTEHRFLGEELSKSEAGWRELPLRRQTDAPPRPPPFRIPEPFVHQAVANSIVAGLQSGAKVCFRGANGSGRATLIRAVANRLVTAGSRVQVLDLTAGLGAPTWTDPWSGAQQEPMTSPTADDIVLVVGYPADDLLRLEVPSWRRRLAELPCTVLATAPPGDADPREGFRCWGVPGISPGDAAVFLGWTVPGLLAVLERKAEWTPRELLVLRRLLDVGVSADDLFEDGGAGFLSKVIRTRSRPEQQLLEILSLFPRGARFAPGFVEETWQVLDPASGAAPRTGPDALEKLGILERINDELHLAPTYWELLKDDPVDHRGVGAEILRDLIHRPGFLPHLMSTRGTAGVRGMLDDARHVARFGRPEKGKKLQTDVRTSQAHEMWRLLTNVVQATSGSGVAVDEQGWVSRLHLAARATVDLVSQSGVKDLHTLVEGLAGRDTARWVPRWVHGSPTGPLCDELVQEKSGTDFDALARAGDGTLLMGDSQGRLWLHRGSGSPRPIKVHDDEIWAIAVDPGGRICTGSDDGKVAVHNLDGNELGQEPHCENGLFVNAVAISPAGCAVFSGGDDTRILEWRMGRDGKLDRFRMVGKLDYGGWVLSLLARTDNELLSGHQGGLLMRWRLVHGRWAGQLAWSARGAWVRTLLSNPSQHGSVFAGLYDGRVVELVDDGGVFRMEKELRHGCAVRGVALVELSGALHVVTGGDDGSIRLWHQGSGQLVRTFHAHRGHVRALLTLDEGRVASAGSDGRVLVWNFATPPMAIVGIAVSDDYVTLTTSAGTISWLARGGSVTGVAAVSSSRPVRLNDHNVIVSGRDGESVLTLLGRAAGAAVSDSGKTAAAWDEAGRVYCFGWRP